MEPVLVPVLFVPILFTIHKKAQQLFMALMVDQEKQMKLHLWRAAVVGSVAREKQIHRSGRACD